MNPGENESQGKMIQEMGKKCISINNVQGAK